MNEEEDFDDVQFGSDDEEFSSDEEEEEFVAETPPRGNDFRGHRELQDNEESQHIKTDRGSVEMGSSRGSTTLGKRKYRGEAKCLHESKAHQENRMLEVIRDDIGNFVSDPGVKFRSFMEGASPSRVVLSAPFIDAIVDSTRPDSNVPTLNRISTSCKSPAVSGQESKQLGKKGSLKSMSSRQYVEQPVQAIDNQIPIFSTSAQPLGLPMQPRVGSQFQSEPILIQRQKNKKVQYCWFCHLCRDAQTYSTQACSKIIKEDGVMHYYKELILIVNSAKDTIYQHRHSGILPIGSRFCGLITFERC
ncbi:hypothetical protein ACFE04_025318 [Oxalis oulophora]